MSSNTADNPIESLSDLEHKNFAFCLLSALEQQINSLLGTGWDAFLTQVPQEWGTKLIRLYGNEWNISKWTPQLLAKAMIDFNKRIGGLGKLRHAGGDEILMEITTCPFGNQEIRKLGGDFAGSR